MNDQEMLDHIAMLRIARLLDGMEWSVDYLDTIAGIVREAGYTVRDLDDYDEDGNLCTVCGGSDPDCKN